MNADLRLKVPRFATLSLVAAILVWLPCGQEANAQGAAPSPPRWTVEVVGGRATLAPKDLNSEADYLTALVDDLRSLQIRQTHEGELARVDAASPLAARVMRSVGRHWGIGAGASFLSVEQRSSAKASYSFTVIDPRAQEYRRDYAETDTVDPLVLSAREFVAHAVARYDRMLWRRLGLGAMAGAGWTIARCRLEQARKVEGGFYPNRREASQVMTGTGHAPAVDVGLTARLVVTRRIGLLVEGGYAWHELKHITGSRDATWVTRDGEAAEAETTQTSAIEGQWVNQPVTYQGSTARWQGAVPAIGAQGSPFTLSLSGWRLAAGFSLGL